MAEKKKNRFEQIYTQNRFAESTQIWIDRETGVNYLYHSDGTGAGLTPLLDREGKPVVTLVDFK